VLFLHLILTLPCHCSPAAVSLLRDLTCSQAYRRLARSVHPDKGGTAAGFAALQAAFETLSDVKRRAVYDALAADVRFRPGAAAPYRGMHHATQVPLTKAPPPPPPPPPILPHLNKHMYP